MEKRRGRARGKLLTAGPGRLTMAMGIDKSFYGADLVHGSVYIEAGAGKGAGGAVQADRILIMPGMEKTSPGGLR